MQNGAHAYGMKNWIRRVMNLAEKVLEQREAGEE